MLIQIEISDSELTSFNLRQLHMSVFGVYDLLPSPTLGGSYNLLVWLYCVVLGICAYTKHDKPYFISGLDEIAPFRQRLGPSSTSLHRTPHGHSKSVTGKKHWPGLVKAQGTKGRANKTTN